MLFGRIFLAFVNSKKKVLAHLDFFFFNYRCNCYVWFITLIASLYTRENKEKIRKRMCPRNS